MGARHPPWPAPGALEPLRALVRVYPRLSVFNRVHPSVPDIRGLRAARRRDIEGDRKFYPRNLILLNVLSHNNLVYPGFEFWIYLTSPSEKHTDGAASAAAVVCSVRAWWVSQCAGGSGCRR